MVENKTSEQMRQRKFPTDQKGVNEATAGPFFQIHDLSEVI